MGAVRHLRKAPLAVGAVLALNGMLAHMLKGLLGTTHVMGRRHVFFRYGDTGNNSCNGFKACYWITGEVDIGDQSCNLDQSCSFSKGESNFPVFD